MNVVGVGEARTTSYTDAQASEPMAPIRASPTLDKDASETLFDARAPPTTAPEKVGVPAHAQDDDVGDTASLDPPAQTSPAVPPHADELAAIISQAAQDGELSDLLTAAADSGESSRRHRPKLSRMQA